MDRIDDAFESPEDIDEERPLVVRPGPSPTTPEREERIRKWREENADYIEGHNDFVEKNGIPFANCRQW